MSSPSGTTPGTPVIGPTGQPTPPLGRSARTSPQIPDGPTDTVRDMRRSGLVAGSALLLLAVLSAVGVLVAVEGLLTPGDAAQTAEDITASTTRFQLGIASLYVVVVLDVVVAWALFRFFAPANLGLSRLAAWMRVAYSVVFLIAISELAAVPDMLSDPGHREVFGEQQLQAEAMLRLEAFDHTYMAGLLLFGVHLALLGYLAYRSGYVPRIIGVLLVLAGAGYAFDTFSSVLATEPVVISTVTFVGELVLAIWLLVRGGRVQVGGVHET